MRLYTTYNGHSLVIMGPGGGLCANSLCRQVLMREKRGRHRWETGRLETSGTGGGVSCHSLLTAFLSCTHAPHPLPPLPAAVQGLSALTLAHGADRSRPQDRPLADFSFLASCFLLHYVQFVSAGLMEQALFPLSSTGSEVFPEIICLFLHFILC